uniref:Reverse transcriptase n=1 Tax=Chenopodium quinoa TaxID=63459 RepID=A0A803MAN0_CHEQI
MLHLHLPHGSPLRRLPVARLLTPRTGCGTPCLTLRPHTAHSSLLRRQPVALHLPPRTGCDPPCHMPTHHPPLTATIPTPPSTIFHSMATRSKHGIVQPNPKYHALHTSPTISPIPKNPVLAIRDPNWKVAMQDEYDALIKNAYILLYVDDIVLTSSSKSLPQQIISRLSLNLL